MLRLGQRSQSYADWAVETGLPAPTIRRRYNTHGDAARALSEPLRPQGRPRGLDADQRREMAALYVAGKTSAGRRVTGDYLAGRYRVDRATIYRELAAAGVLRRRLKTIDRNIRRLFRKSRNPKG